MNTKREKKYMYGKFHADTHEFHRAIHDIFSELIEKHKPEMEFNNDIVGVRNKVVALLDSWIGAKKLETKFGIKIPLSATPPSIKDFLEKQARSSNRAYRACEICGESRITHYCHIIPHSDGGPNADENYLYLCPVHHHLFDHNRLSKEEWSKIDFSKKLVPAQEYAQKVRLAMLEKYWEKNVHD